MRPLVVHVIFLVASVAVGAFTHAAAYAEDLTFGMSTALTGPTKDLGIEMQRGVLTAFERANTAGGIQGYQLKLIALDDGYEPSRTGPNMHTLVDDSKILGIIGNVGTPTAIVAIPIAVQSKTLFFAAFSGAGVLRASPPERYVINYRASYAEEIATTVDGLIEQVGLKPAEIAFFTQRDGFGDAGFAGGLAALKKHGFTDESSLLHVQYERNTLAVENAVADIVGARVTPKAIIMVGVYAPCAKFIKLAKDNGVKALFINVSFVGSESLARQLSSASSNVFITQVVPPRSSEATVVSDFLADLTSQGNAGDFTIGALEGYIAGRILSKALENEPAPFSRDGVIQALEKLGTFDVGTGTRLELSPTQHQASHAVWLTKIENLEIVPTTWAAVKNQLKGIKGK